MVPDGLNAGSRSCSSSNSCLCSCACRHHPEDVLAAQMLGLLMAGLFYLQAFASPFSVHAGRLSEELCVANEAQQEGAAGEERAWQEGERSEPLLA